ncbi:hypothetical protein RXV94_06110 [Yeosuana sp. MJ-SS3]|uniref:Tetratricopeptide repeat protein n=1 Tax=Gilvirhabdus luticola TaxID=3079858 RepID=A0ABU3U5T9_9FLAO|nr:hypothetical protein [Yeosuana sp. MJ-SS3]MDU8885726.1 hypothetical protein [Yeosuana sp. MJ-SS3]
MNKTDFISLLQNPVTIQQEQTENLKSVIDEFPYFQSARAIYLKGLKNSESYKYNQELKVTAAYTADRSILFDFITSEEFTQNEISEFIKQNTEHLKDIDVTVEEVSVYKSLKIDEALQNQIKDAEKILDPSLFQPKITPSRIANFELDKDQDIENAGEEENISTEESSFDILNLGKPLQFHRSELHSFNEWLKLTSFKPIEREENNIEKVKNVEASTDKSEASKNLGKRKKFELIDKFISKNPKIDPSKESNVKHNIAKEQMIQPESLMTETLARIYVEQKNYKKAIQSYKILSLKYPEKSGFFADQIKAIKKLPE